MEEYFTKVEAGDYDDLKWNIPEQKKGKVNIIGGNSQSFKAVVKTTEIMSKNYNLEVLNVVLPSSLESKLPSLPNLKFLSSNESGAFDDADELKEVMSAVDFNLMIGDMSRNSETARVVASVLEVIEKPTLITRDAVDLIAEQVTEKMLANENLIFLASMPQLVKILKAVYYPKMLLLNQSLIQVAGVLHKFTLSYPTNIITLHDDQVLIAKGGQVKAVALSELDYSPLAFWMGDPAVKITVMNLYNPNNFLNASVSALF